MKLKTDHSFHIGEQHLRQGKPCQDYALSGHLTEDMAYAIVADGCSSGGLTDVGARLMVLATKQALMSQKDNPILNVPAVTSMRDRYLRSYQETLGLAPQDLLATCLWAVARNDQILAHVTGDGAVVVKYQDDHTIHRFDWHNNMPYYPAYGLNNMNEGYKAALADSAEPLTYIEEDLAPIGAGGCRDGALHALPIEVGMQGVSIVPQQYENPEWPGPMQSVGLFTDGIEQIDGIEYDQAAQELLAFKSTSGQFVTRRTNRFLQEAKKIGRGPMDDIAMAVITLDHANQGECDVTYQKTNEA